MKPESLFVQAPNKRHEVQDSLVTLRQTTDVSDSHNRQGLPRLDRRLRRPDAAWNTNNPAFIQPAPSHTGSGQKLSIYNTQVNIVFVNPGIKQIVRLKASYRNRQSRAALSLLKGCHNVISVKDPRRHHHIWLYAFDHRLQGFQAALPRPFGTVYFDDRQI